MSYRRTVWTTLERWSPMAFLAAGGLFLLPAVASGFEATTGKEIDMSPLVIFGFLLVVFVGLLGLYPRLAERDATLALGGLGLLGATAAIIVSTLALSVLATGPPVGKSTFLAIVMSVVLGTALTLATFGAASLRTGAHPRPVGGFLLVVAAAVSLLFVAILSHGHDAPSWVSLVVDGLFPISLGAVGYVLRIEDTPAGTPDSTDDVTAS